MRFQTQRSWDKSQNFEFKASNLDIRVKNYEKKQLLNLKVTILRSKSIWDIKLKKVMGWKVKIIMLILIIWHISKSKFWVNYQKYWVKVEILPYLKFLT